MITIFEGMLEGIGRVCINLFESMQFIWKKRINNNHVLQQLASIGFDSVPIALIICLISGSVLALHAADIFAMTGANNYVGALVALAMVREMAPIFTALAIGARSGTAIASEIANMAVTNQLDALKVMNISPVRYLMVPRLIACVVSMPLVTLLSQAVGIFGGMVVAKTSAGIHYSMFLDSIWLNLEWYDIEVSLIKAFVFGLILAGITVTVGLSSKGGAKDVGLASTQATVWTAITIIIADFFLTWMLFGTTFVD